jgi:hypothetical protein
MVRRYRWLETFTRLPEDAYKKTVDERRLLEREIKQLGGVVEIHQSAAEIKLKIDECQRIIFPLHQRRAGPRMSMRFAWLDQKARKKRDLVLPLLALD